MRPYLIGFEGAFSYPRFYIRDDLFIPLRAKYVDIEYENCYWAWAFPKNTTDRDIIVVGHDVGCTKALEYAREINAYACVTLDPRQRWWKMSSTFCAQGLRTYNFYRTGILGGSRVQKAVSNVQLSSSVLHQHVPRQQEVFDRMSDLIDGIGYWAVPA